MAVVVAISGGGQRAGNFGAGILCGLEKIKNSPDGVRDALQEVDYLSTVSGGGMAAGAYMSSLHTYLDRPGNPARNDYSFEQALSELDNADTLCKKSNVREFYGRVSEEHPKPVTDPCLHRHLERGYHNNIAGALTSPKVWFTAIDRGDLLEDAFAKEIMGGNWRAEELTLKDVFVPINSVEKPRLPYWICNATVYENGAIFPFTPGILDEYEIIGYTHGQEPFELKEGEDAKIFRRQMPLSVGMAASGAFPALIAPCTLKSDDDPKNPYLHLIDGGVADNLGIITAVDLLNQDTAAKKVLIVVDAFPGEFAPYSRNEGAPNMFLTYLSRMPTMPLNGWRGRHVKLLNLWCESKGIELVLFSFDDLYGYSVDDLDLEDAASLPDYNAPTDASKNVPDYSLWKKARTIETSYNISAAEQQLLLKSGLFLVRRKTDEIREKLGWPVASETAANAEQP